jgi:hypothetical protein
VWVDRRDVVSSSGTGVLLFFAAKRLRTESIWEEVGWVVGGSVLGGGPVFEGEDRVRGGANGD